jgi:hypothetical protein
LSDARQEALGFAGVSGVAQQAHAVEQGVGDARVGGRQRFFEQVERGASQFAGLGEAALGSQHVGQFVADHQNGGMFFAVGCFEHGGRLAI